MRLSVAGRQGISLLLSTLKSILDEEAAFCAGWLGLGASEAEVEGGGGKGGRELAGEQGEGVKERVLSKVFGFLVRQVLFVVVVGGWHGLGEHGHGVGCGCL